MVEPLVEVIVWQMAMDEKTRGPIVILQAKNGAADRTGALRAATHGGDSRWEH